MASSRGSKLSVFLKLVAIFACGVGVYSVFFAGDVFTGMTLVWVGGMQWALSGMVDAV